MIDGLDAVHRMFRAIECGDCDGADAYLSLVYANCESLDDGRSTKRGPEEFTDTVRWLQASFSNLRFEEVDVIACADRVVMVVYMCGVHTGAFLGIAATNRPFRQRQAHIFRVDAEGKVSEHLAMRDDLGLRRQLLG